MYLYLEFKLENLQVYILLTIYVHAQGSYWKVVIMYLRISIGVA